MKQSAEYAKRFKRLVADWGRKFGKPPAPEETEPLEQLIIGILAGCTTYAKAHAAFRKIRSQMVDLNELRVTPASELADAIGDAVPRAKEKAARIINALNAIRKRQDSLDISFLKERGRREAREYLESLEGVDAMAAASVVVFSLGGHAVPVDDLTRYVLQKEEIVDPAADPADVQAFLERQVGSTNARVFADQLNRYVTTKGARVPVEKLHEMLAPRAAARGAANGEKVAAATPAPVPAKSDPPPKPSAAPVKAAVKHSAKEAGKGKAEAVKVKATDPVKVKAAVVAKVSAGKPKPHAHPRPATVKKKK